MSEAENYMYNEIYDSTSLFSVFHTTIDPNLGSPGDGFNQPNPPGKRRKKSRVSHLENIAINGCKN